MEQRMYHILGIDIGGTKAAISIGTESGEILHSERIPMNPLEPDPVLTKITEIAQRFIAQTPAEIDAIGISAPGPMCSKRQMILDTPNMKGWSNLKLGDYFHNALHLPTFMQNDANGAGLAEYLFGGQKGKDLIYLTMSTGIGAGVISNGQLVRGANDLGGEVGHIPLVPNGRRCACGKKGCWEAYCGGKALAEHIQTDLRESDQQTLLRELVHNQLDQLTMHHICEAVRRNDAYTAAKWDEFIEHMAHAVGILIQTMNPEAITMGTIAIHAGDLFLPQMQERLGAYAWAGGMNVCTIEASVLKNIGELSAIAVGLDGLKNG
jgi:glucokinase